MMDLNEINVFVKVAQVKSFSHAAKELAMPKSTVSSKVTALEKRLGVSLLQRTTRRMSLTPAGQNFFEQSLHALDQLRIAEAKAAEAQHHPQGILRLTAPVELGSVLLPSVLGDFQKSNPQVKFEIQLSDQRVDLLKEGIDLALRAGALEDSSLIAKKLGTAHFALFASANYLKNKKQPKHPKDLSQHRTLHFQELGTNNWKLNSRSMSLSVSLSPSIISNDLNFIKTLAIAGEGIALLPTFLCYVENEKGKLINILPEWKSQIRPVHFVYPAQKFILPKLKSFIQFAGDPIRERLKSFEL